MKINALQKIYICTKSMYGDMEELKRDYLTFVSEANCENLRLNWAAKKLGCFCTLQMLDYDLATEEYTDLLDEAPFPSDSLLVEMDLLYVGQLREDNLDNFVYYDREIMRLEDMLETIDDIAQNRYGIIPVSHDLLCAYPNPFNSRTNIGYQLKNRSLVSIRIFDSNGRETATLLNESRDAGTYKILWDSGSAPAGVYFCKMSANEFVKTQKLTLIK